MSFFYLVVQHLLKHTPLMVEKHTLLIAQVWGIMGMCLTKAGDLCGSKGYDVLTSAGDKGFIASANPEMAFAGNTISRNLLIACKSELAPWMAILLIYHNYTSQHEHWHTLSLNDHQLKLSLQLYSYIPIINLYHMTDFQFLFTSKYQSVYC